MGSLSNYAENRILEHSLAHASWTMPTNVYAALFTVTPTESGGGTEVSGPGYARFQCAFNTASGGVITNSTAMRWPAMGNSSANWGVIIAIGVFDSLTGGNLIWFGPTSAPISVGVGDFFSIASSGLSVTID